MTLSSVRKEGRLYKGVNTAFVLLLMLLMICYSKQVKSSIIYGMGLSFTTVIPTLFPFLVFADALSHFMGQNNCGIIGKAFHNLLGFPPRMASAFILGTLCGFPLGVRMAAKEYHDGNIDKSTLEDICALCASPSPAFIISGVGIGIYGSIEIGILLYLSMLISIFITAFILQKKHGPIINSQDSSRQSFDLIASISSAGITSVAVASYIIFFSSLIGLTKAITGSDVISALASLFLEVSSACSSISSINGFTESLRLCLVAFAIGFSGLSVHLQYYSMLPKDISKSRFLSKKLLQGILSALILFILLTIKKAVLR